MWLVNLKTFVKQLLNNKLYTLITVLGFAISLCFVILLTVYLSHELSVNTNQANKEHIYRLRSERNSGFAPPIANWLQTKFPEIESTTRVFTNTGLAKVPSKDGLIKFRSLLVDSTFFHIFDIQLIEGNKNSAFDTKNSIVISKEYAQKVFGDKSPIGKTISIADGVPCTITGVFDNLTKDTHFSEADGLINFNLLADLWMYPEVLTSWDNCSFDLYLMEKQNTNLPTKAPEILKLFKERFWIYKEERSKEVIFEALPDVYFSSVGGQGIRKNSRVLLGVLLIIVILILVLSVINYINLTIAQSGTRAKNIAIRKLVGSSRFNLIKQHIIESIVLILFAFAMAILLAFLAESTFNDLLQTQLRLNDAFTLVPILLTSLFIAFIGFVSGIIPAIIITKLKAVEVIKGGFRRKSKTLYSRVLIGFQYVIVIALIISTIVISKQTNFMMNKDIGYKHKNIIQLPNYTDESQEKALRNEFLKIPHVTEVSYVAGNPVDGGNNNSFIYDGRPVSFQIFIVDSAFFKMTNIKSKPTGVAYSKDGIWLNQTAVRKLGLDSLPTHFNQLGKNHPVLGVLNDFNFEALNEEIGPLMIQQMDTNTFPWNILVELDGKDLPETIEKIETTYKKLTNNSSFEYEFLDQTIAKWYDNERRMGIIIKYFSILSIIISVMGIFAMSVYYNQQKVKEIGIRRVNGATVFEIIKMLNKDFIKWIVIAFIIAVPIAYFAMSRWLESFAYKIELSWWIFVLAGLITMFIALFTVSWNTFFSARRNPVKSLKYE